MSVGVNPPKTPVTEGSHGIATATLPNMCKMPGPPAPFVPTPLPNIGKSGNSPDGYSTTVKIEDNAVAIKGASFCSMGDVASKALGGGMASMNTEGPCKFIGPGATDVQFDGGNVQLLSDQVTNNGGASGSPSNSATMMGLVQGISVTYVENDGDLNCPHPHMERSEKEKETRRRSKQEMKRTKALSKARRKLNRAVKVDAQGKFALANRLLNQAISLERNATDIAFEQRVANETNSEETTIEYKCPDCGMKSEFDVITDKGTIKECKSSAGAVDFSQFQKHISAARALFPGAAVHIAVPAGAGGDVTPAIPQESVQEH